MSLLNRVVGASSRLRLRLAGAARCAINGIARRLGVVVMPEDRVAMLRKQRRSLLDLAQARVKHEHATEGVVCIVFSKDRPMQLHALLASCHEMIAGALPVFVLYQASDSRYEAAYGEVERIFAPLGYRFIKQAGFRENVLTLLATVRSEKVMFLVDDILFIEPLRLAELLHWDSDRFIPSLRLGKNLSYCYTLQRKQRLPNFVEGEFDGQMLAWRWAEGEHEWGYPMSLDGHVFARDEVLVMALASSFSSPNTLEVALASFADCLGDRLGVCFPKSRIVNVPCNRVQTDNDNIHMRLDPRYLLEQWEAGYQIDYRRLRGFENKAAHQEIVLPLVTRASVGAGNAA